MRYLSKRVVFSYLSIIFVFFLSITIFLKKPLLTQLPLIIFATIITTLFLSLLNYIFFIKPFRLFLDRITQMSDGDYQKKIFLFRSDLYGEMANKLNNLSETIESKIEQITRDKNELRAVLSSMVEGVLVISDSEQILHISPSMIQMLQLESRGNLINRKYWEVIRFDEINSLIKNCLNHKTTSQKDFAILSPNEKYFDVQVSPVLNENILTSVVVVFHDITSHKKFDRMRTEFVANVSHELKTPLTSIKGFVETLEAGAVEDQENAKHFLKIISKQTERLENLVTDLLSLSALESQPSQLKKENHNIQTIIENIVISLQNSIDSKNHQLEINFPNDAAIVNIDKEKIEQVFINLINNAIKFTPPNGKIMITASMEPNFLKINVSDTGIGVSQDHLTRLFERFYRIDKARSSDLGGTGLGLSIVKHIVQAHQGKVTVASELEKGTTFSVWLPVENA